MDPVAILKVGVSGLIFFLSLWSYRLISKEQERTGTPRKGILNTIYIFLGANFLFATLVAVSSFVQTQSDGKTMSAKVVETAELEKKLDSSEKKNTRYRELMAELATSIDQKVEYELQLEQGNVATLKPTIKALIRTVKKAREEALIDPE